MEFSHKTIEQKGQKYGDENNVYRTTINSNKKSYILDMFPYPSGSGLHVGHLRGYTATDVISRMKRLQGYDVLHPIGWDAFGLPAEQYALQTGNDPSVFTIKNINNFRRQLKSLGYSYDYSKEINTSSPDYFKTTQGIFEQLYKNGLAKIEEVDVNGCEELKTVLANEEVLNINGKMFSERGNYLVIKKPMRQGVLKITKYAEKLLEGLKELDWPKNVKELQKNGIGKSTGIEIEFAIEDGDNKSIVIFTTRADTIFGVEYLALAPEHKLIKDIIKFEFIDNVNNFINFVKNQTYLERQNDSKEKFGVFTGSYAINPINNKRIPIGIANYVLPFYATEAIMGVPGHNKKDFSFALKYGIPITYVIEGYNTNSAYLKDGGHINSDFLDGLNIEESIKKVEKILIERNKAVRKINYKLKNGLFSRQRYGGEPFPIIHGNDGSISLVDENELPIELPKMNNIKLSNTGESPLANAKDGLTIIDSNGKIGRRETNTMPQGAGSCGYYLGYILKEGKKITDIKSKRARQLFNKGLPVDLYVGGQEHAVSHLLYARFGYRFLYDINIVPSPEPFKKLINQGMILGKDGTKMSKSKNNAVIPDDIVKSHGADALRLYEMFMGPINMSLQWNIRGLDSIRKGLDRVYRLVKNNNFINVNTHKLDFAYHNMVKNSTNMLENLCFNTAISQLMIFINLCYKNINDIYQPYFEGFVKILSCFAPHLAEEIWNNLGYLNSIVFEKWPTFSDKYLNLYSNNVTVIVQINGKLRTKLEVLKDSSKDVVLSLLKKDKNIQLGLKNHKISRVIFIKNKIINLVLS